MVYEVAWSRALSLVMGSTIYAFSAMLTTFLIGLALGSFICAIVVERLRSRVLLFGLVQIGIGILGYLTLHLLGEVPYLFVRLYQWITFPQLLTPVISFAMALLVMLLPTLMMGTLFPLAIKILQVHLPTFGRLAGDVYAVNTMGAILGAFCGGFVLIPLFGIQGSALSMVYLNLILGVLLMIIAPRMGQGSSFRTHRLVRWGLAGATLLLAGSLAAVKPSWNAQIMSTGVFLHLPEHAVQLGQADRKKFYQELEKDRELFFYKEGITATITVERDRLFGLYMRVNGRKEAGERFMRTQALIAHIPLIMAQKPDDVLIIGFGSGATAGSVAQY
ncbi:MAG: fused MFS/spermidine synthase, partial [Nitrospiria bacterium]